MTCPKCSSWGAQMVSLIHWFMANASQTTWDYTNWIKPLDVNQDESHEAAFNPKSGSDDIDLNIKTDYLLRILSHPKIVKLSPLLRTRELSIKYAFPLDLLRTCICGRLVFIYIYSDTWMEWIVWSKCREAEGTYVHS